MGDQIDSREVMQYEPKTFLWSQEKGNIKFKNAAVGVGDTVQLR